MSNVYLCVNKDEHIVLLAKRWHKPGGGRVISVYGFVGVKQKRRQLLYRCVVEPDEFTVEASINHAHLWALRNGVSDYLVFTKESHLPKLFHPMKEYRDEL